MATSYQNEVKLVTVFGTGMSPRNFMLRFGLEKLRRYFVHDKTLRGIGIYFTKTKIT